MKSRSSRPKCPYAAVLLVDRAAQVEALDDRGGAQVEDSCTSAGRASPGRSRTVPNVSTITDTGCATPIAYATCTSQRVGDAGGDDVLRHVAHRVGGRAVDLRRVLAAERAATVTGHAAVGVDDDLATGEAAVGVRTAELERAGRVDEHLEVVVGELLGHERAG